MRNVTQLPMTSTVRTIEHGQFDDHRHRQEDKQHDRATRYQHHRRQRGRIEHVSHRRHVQRHECRAQQTINTIVQSARRGRPSRWRQKSQ